MISAQEIPERLKLYISKQLDVISEDNILMKFAKPFITRFTDNNMYKVDTFLKMFSDKDGNIDIEGILDDITTNVINSKPFTVNTGFIGDVIIGDGQIKLTIPGVNKRISFDYTDLEEFKNQLIKKNI